MKPGNLGILQLPSLVFLPRALDPREGYTPGPGYAGECKRITGLCSGSHPVCLRATLAMPSLIECSGPSQLPPSPGVSRSAGKVPGLELCIQLCSDTACVSESWSRGCSPLPGLGTGSSLCAQGWRTYSGTKRP